VPTSAAFATPQPSVRLAGSANQPKDEDSVHFQQVFEEYIALRIKCGESASSVAATSSSPSCAATGATNRKYNCRSARFSVYVKDGKAAIKATPVRS